MWGSSGNSTGQFKLPQGVAVDADGYVYVADMNNNRIQKFTGCGEYVLQWGVWGYGEGQFRQPRGIADDADGYIYVADRNNHRIQKFTSEGVFIKEWGSQGSGDGQFQQPAGVAIDAENGWVYVVDQYNHRVQKFTSEGVYVHQWGSFGTTEGYFIYPHGIAVDSQHNVYVTERGFNFLNHRVQKFDSDGVFITEWGSFGSSDRQFKQPYDVAVDSEDNVYVADTYNDRIQKFDSSGGFKAKWGSSGNSTAQFNKPRGIAIDSDGYFYIVDSDNGRVQVFGTATPEILRCMVGRLFSEGEIDNPGIYNSLLQQLDAAIEKIDKGQEKPAENILNAFINHVSNQAGQNITQEAAETLSTMAQHVIENL